MFPTDYTITPTEILALEDYINKLQDTTFHQEEISSKSTNQSILDSARQLLKFHADRANAGGTMFRLDEKPYNLDVFIARAEHDFGLKQMLVEHKYLFLNLLDLYNKSLERNNRHQVLKKSIAEITGYDLYKIAYYVLHDIKAEGTSPEEKK